MHPTREYVDLAGEGFDLAICAVPDKADLAWSGLDVEPVARVLMVAIAAPSLLIDPSCDLQALPWLEHEGMTTKLTMMQKCGLEIDRLAFVPIGSANLLLEAVRQGLGATIFSEQFTRENIAAGRLVEVPLPHKLFARYVAVTPKRQRHHLIVPCVKWVRSLF